MGTYIVDQILPTAIKSRRQRYSIEFKRDIVVETFTSGESVARIARKHGINANQLSTWRRLYTRNLLDPKPRQEPRLLPVTIHEMESSSGVRHATASAPTENGLTLILAKGQLNIHGRPDLDTLRLVLQAMTS